MGKKIILKAWTGDLLWVILFSRVLFHFISYKHTSNSNTDPKQRTAQHFPIDGSYNLKDSKSINSPNRAD